MTPSRYPVSPYGGPAVRPSRPSASRSEVDAVRTRIRIRRARKLRTRASKNMTRIAVGSSRCSYTYADYFTLANNLCCLSAIIGRSLLALFEAGARAALSRAIDHGPRPGVGLEKGLPALRPRGYMDTPLRI
ncbi:hypothetical protein EVAR_10150_1 [Eumeta japonica]|uniref:Uncharacterized protein n=1 Tax=Eumeta variegata TaxID=151549 RepID=A0A4C1UCG8_EUMVA|nr:hypothetical protein EVAR_10150_1 [Eumeta japonica]